MFLLLIIIAVFFLIAVSAASRAARRRREYAEQLEAGREQDSDAGVAGNGASVSPFGSILDATGCRRPTSKSLAQEAALAAMTRGAGHEVESVTQQDFDEALRRIRTSTEAQASYV
ncbi:MAG: hypothetical protein H0W87_01585 [Actinobacteria bacterium]|nr:hypothetical protein [Actinomycetota bacterium]